MLFLAFSGGVMIGMIVGAWIAARGYEKAMVSAMKDPEAPWNKED